MSDFYIYNTLGRQIQRFQPIEPGRVKMYTCGPTVYNYAHIGNLRTYISEDILLKALKAHGYEVDRVMNITDVGHLQSDADEGPDKMVEGAKRENKAVYEIAQYFEDAFFVDLDKLNIEKPQGRHRATDYIQEYIELIQGLEKKGYTYFAGGNVYFDISKFPDYTKLSGANLEDQITGARDTVGHDSHKKNPQDFVLWFTKSKFEKQAMKWESPWGTGYPGWHIECSAISLKTLGPRIDIHCGGVDHIAIHHTNEIAQTESFTGSPWVSYWWHSEFLIDETGKMSKSRGDFLTLKLLEEKSFDPLAYRYYCLGSHYRMQLAFSFENLKQAQSAYFKLRNRCLETARQSSPESSQEGISSSGKPVLKQDKISDAGRKILDDFHRHIGNDLNTANGITELYNLLKSDIPATEKHWIISKMDEVLSLSLLKPLPAPDISGDEAQKIEDMIEKRNLAKKDRDFETADKIRDELNKMGISLEDGPDGTSWTKI